MNTLFVGRSLAGIQERLPLIWKRLAWRRQRAINILLEAFLAYPESEPGCRGFAKSWHDGNCQSTESRRKSAGRGQRVLVKSVC